MTSTDLFLGCTSLVGENGTAYNREHIDNTYALIDGLDENPGYFTQKGSADEWLPMQAQIANGTMIDFYPAFNQGDTTVAKYKFAVKKDNTYSEVQPSSGSITMLDISSALKNSSFSDSNTLYYQKIDPNADPLKCYTVKDLSWNYVFGSSAYPSGGKATAFSSEFHNDYQLDIDGQNNGITSPLLDSNFGSG